MRLTGDRAGPINPRNESSSGHHVAQYYYRTGKGSDATSVALTGPQGSVRTWPFAGLFYWPRAVPEMGTGFRKIMRQERDEWRQDERKDDDHDTRNDRRRNGDGGARRPGREAPVRLSGRRGAADLRRAVRAGQRAAHPGAARAGRGARGGRLCALDRQGRLRAGDLRPRRDQCGDRPDRRAVRTRSRSSASPARFRPT